MIAHILAAVCTVSVLQLTAAEPTCHMSEVMTCLDYVANYINALPKRSSPQPSDTTELCKNSNAYLDCWDSYKKRCMSPMQAEIEVLLTEGIRNLNTEFCTEGSETNTRFLKNAECLSRSLKVDKASDNIDRIMVMVENFDTIPNIKRIRYACCSWNQMYNRAINVVGETCGDEAVKAVEDSIAIAASELPQVLCQSFEPESDKCQEILPPDGTKPSGKETPYTKIVKYFFKSHI